MEQELMYALQVIICSGLLYCFYKLVLEGKTAYGLCRIYLISAIPVSAIIPLLKIPVLAGATIEITAVSTSYINYEAVTGYESGAAIALQQVWSVYMLIVYGTVLLFLLLGIVSQIISINGYKRNARKTEEAGVKVYESDRIKTPFTFFRKVFLPTGLEGAEREQILTHEASHVRHNHGVEILYMEIFKATMWFNPFVWLSRHALEQVHEYQADNDVLQTGQDIKNYKTILFMQLTGYSPDISSGLACSKTKKRFMMMEKSRPARRSALRITAAIPLVGAMLLLFSFTTKEPVYVITEKIESLAVTDGPQTYYFIDGKEVSKIEVDNLDPETIETVDVTADGELLEKYGKPANSIGLVMVSTKKKDTEPVVHVDKITGTNAIVYIDGKKAEQSAFEQIKSGSIESVSVLKGENAVAMYGEEGVDGVVIITTKADNKIKILGDSLQNGGVRPANGKVTVVTTRREDASLEAKPEKAGEKTVITTKYSFSSGGEDQDVALIIDGQEVSKIQMDNIDAEEIESVSILKDVSARELYGKESAIIIITKKTNVVTQRDGVGETGNISSSSIGWNTNPESVRSLPGKIRYILDNNEISKKQFRRIDSENVESITVIKDKKSMEISGFGPDSDIDAVVIIKTIQE